MKLVGRRAGLGTLLILTALSLAACGDLLSMHALNTRQDQVFDAAVEGHWESDDNLLEVKRTDSGYEVTLQARKVAEPPTKFEMHLVDLNGVRFGDLLQEDHIGHMLMRVRLGEGRGEERMMRVDFFDSQWLRDRVPHQEADIENFRKVAILTQSTPQLKALVAKYAKEEKAFADETVFRRGR